MKRQGHSFLNDSYESRRIIRSLARVIDYLNESVLDSDRLGNDPLALVYADVIAGHELTDNVAYGIAAGSRALQELMCNNRNGLTSIIQSLQDFKSPGLLQEMDITVGDFLEQEKALLVQAGLNPVVAQAIATGCRTQINSLPQLEISNAQRVIDAFQDLQHQSCDTSSQLKAGYQASIDLMADGPRLKKFFWGFAGSLLIVASGVEFFDGKLPPDIAAIYGGLGEFLMGIEGGDPVA